MYVMQRQTYLRDIEIAKDNLRSSIENVNEIFPNNDFLCLTGELEKYDENVQIHYKEYLKTNEVWNRIKVRLREEKLQ